MPCFVHESSHRLTFGHSAQGVIHDSSWRYRDESSLQVKLVNFDIHSSFCSRNACYGHIRCKSAMRRWRYHQLIGSLRCTFALLLLGGRRSRERESGLPGSAVVVSGLALYFPSKTCKSDCQGTSRTLTHARVQFVVDRCGAVTSDNRRSVARC